MTLTEVALVISRDPRTQEGAHWLMGLPRPRCFTHPERQNHRLYITNRRELAWFELDGIDPVGGLTLEDALRSDWYEVAS